MINGGHTVPLEFWITLWKAVLIVGLGLFATLAVVVTIGRCPRRRPAAQDPARRTSPVERAQQHARRLAVTRTCYLGAHLDCYLGAARWNRDVFDDPKILIALTKT